MGIKKINVLYISHELKSIGGSTKSLLNMISSLEGKIYPIIIVSTYGESCKEFEKNGIEALRP